MFPFRAANRAILPVPVLSVTPLRTKASPLTRR